MSKCTQCTSRLVYTTYIRVTKRNPRTHHNNQSWEPAGILCMDCGSFQLTLDIGVIAMVQRRRSARQVNELPQEADQL